MQDVKPSALQEINDLRKTLNTEVEGLRQEFMEVGTRG